MARYSIKDLENYTQIKAHTLRIWEQRYNLLTPKRTETNIRYYSDDDLKKLLNINLLYTNGLKISKIAKLTEEEILSEVQHLIKEDHQEDLPEIDQLIISVTAMDTDGLQNQLEKYYQEYGMEKMYESIITPVLIKIGKLWQVNALSIGHEHLFSNILRDFFILKIQGIEQNKSNTKKALLFLHEHEEHELSLLFYYYLLKNSGFNCFYLGACVPIEDLQKSVEQIQPDLLITNLLAKVDQKEITTLFEEISKFFDLSNVKAGGYQVSVYSDVIPSEVNKINSLEDLVS